MVRWRRLLLSCFTSNVLASTLYYFFFFFFFTTSHLKDIYFTSVSLHIAAAFKIHPGPSARPTAEVTCRKKPNTARSHTVQVSPKTHLHLIAETLLRPWPTEVTSCSDASIWPLPVLLRTNQDKTFIPNRHSLKKNLLQIFTAKASFFGAKRTRFSLNVRH